MSIGIGALLTLVGIGALAWTAKSFRSRMAARSGAPGGEARQGGGVFRRIIEVVGETIAFVRDPKNLTKARLAAGLRGTPGIPLLFVCGVLSLAIGLFGLAGAVKRERTKRLMEAFIAAAGSGDVATVRRMLDDDPLLVNSAQRGEFVRHGVDGADIALGSVIVNRPLHAAAKGLRSDVVELLLARGARVDADLEDGTTALHAVGDVDATDEKVSENRVAIIKLLVARGASVNARDEGERTPLHVNAHDPKAAEALLAHHADVNARDGSGSTPLHYLVTSRSDTSEAIRMLIEHGADVNARSHTGSTPLLLASTNLPVLQTLMAHGAVVNVSDSSGRTPLHEIASTPSNLSSEDLDVLAILCSSGLRPDVADRAGETPLSIARARLAANTSSGWLRTRRRIVQYLSPDGPCNRLARSKTAVTKEQRSFIAAELACAENDVKACENLAWFYDSGKGVEADKSHAASLYDKTCGLGSPFACTSLAFLYESGQGVAKDPSRAATLYAPACDAGETRACFNLAVLYSEGRGVAKDHPRAITLFRRACDGGDAEGCKEAAAPARTGEGPD